MANSAFNAMSLQNNEDLGLWLDVLISNMKTSAGDMEILTAQYKHVPFLHQMRNIEDTQELENFVTAYTPQDEFIPYLVRDVEEILTVFKNIILCSEKFTISDEEIYKVRTIAEMYLTPHGLLRSKHDPTVNPNFQAYFSILETARNIFYNNLINIETFVASKAEIFECLGAVASFFEEYGKATLKILETTGTVVQETGQKAIDITDGLLTKLFSIVFKLVFPVALVGGGLVFGYQWIKRQPSRNPPDFPADLVSNEEYKILWNRTKSLNSKVEEKEFKDALKLFYAQNSRVPKLDEISLVNGSAYNLAVMVGKVPNLTYIPVNGRKSPYHYKHDMEETILATDSTGKNLFLLGQTYLDSLDGWLKK